MNHCCPERQSAGAWLQVVSGLAKYIPLEAMQGRRVVLVANLKPANMRGVKSQAMVLAATSTDGTKVHLYSSNRIWKPCTRRMANPKGIYQPQQVKP